MNENYYAVIMAGGVGSRFWPLSRENKPKQFLDILGTGETLLQQTFRRLRQFCKPENILIVTHASFNDIVKEQVPEIISKNILLEPMRKNTAPCIAYATYKIIEKNPNAVVAVMPSDHIILREDVFTKTVTTAMKQAELDDKIITLGITPSRPETGYGYIQYKQNGDQSNEIRKVKTFTEKPQYELAVKFIDSGDFLWNAGIFISSVKTLVSSFNKHLPDVATIFHNGSQHYYTDSENGFIKEAYSMCPNISMDYGIMEKADNVYVIEADMGWSDIGTWSALFDNSEKNQENNLVNSDNIYTYDVDNCIIRIEKNKVAVIQGLENYIVIDEGDALLICKIDNEQNIKNYVEKIKKDKKFTYL